jgi:hypothetical protein
MLAKITYLLGAVFNKILPTPADLLLCIDLARISRTKEPAGNTSCLVQMPEDFSMLIRIATLLSLIRPRRAFGVRLKLVRDEPRSVGERLNQFLESSRLGRIKWRLFYGFTGVTPRLDFTEEDVPVEEIQKIRSGLDPVFPTKASILEISFDGIPVGDLIYDTYIRFKPAPTVDVMDPFLEKLVEEAIRHYLLSRAFLDKEKVDLLVTTFTSYIQHGILARLCLSRGIEVLALGAMNQLLVRPTREFPFHKRAFLKYKMWADAYPDQSGMLEKAGGLIENRLSGGRDQITVYMKNSAYSGQSTSLSLAKDKKSALIMAHDFYDSPHTWGDMLFPDFYEWLDFLLKTAAETEHDFYLKPHPNALRESGPIFEDFFRKYPKVRRIDPATSNLALVRSGFRCAFTLNGTVAHEFSYLGLPTICAGTNPHSAFDFTRSAASLEEFRKMVFELPSWTIDRNEVLKFVFMHNYCFLEHGISSYFNIGSATAARAEIRSSLGRIRSGMLQELGAIQDNRDFL